MRYSNLVFTVYSTLHKLPRIPYTHTLMSTPPSVSRFLNIRHITFTVHHSLSYTDVQPSLKSSDFKISL